MDLKQKEALAHLGDMGLASTAVRLRAAILYAKMQQKDFAAACGVSATVLSNALGGLTYPGRDVMVYLYRAHRIDFNFILHGDFAQLPGDVQEHLFPALEAAASEWDRKERSGQNRAKSKSSQAV